MEHQISKARLREAEAIAQRVPEVLRQRGLRPAFSDWLLTAEQEQVWLFGVLDVAKIERLERYTTAEVLHHLATDLGGRRVYLSNHSGLRYAVLLSRPPRLPQRVDLPGVQRGFVILGQQHTGVMLSVPWARLGHLLVAGKTGAGKSAFNRLLVYQALAEGFRLLLADLDGATFPMLAEHPALLAPLARTPAAMLAVVERALGECDHRAGLYGQMSGYPETLEEYNTEAVRNGAAILPRVLVVLDEFNAAVMATGGAQGTLATTVATLGWRGRKFGLNLIFSAQDFTKATVGRVRDQVSAAICFRVRGAEIARAIGCPDAVNIPESRPGLAMTDRWGPVQACYLDKALLVQEATGKTATILSLAECEMVRWALTQNNSYLGLTDIQDQLHIGQRPARRLAEEWELRGWLEKDTQMSNRRRITPQLRAQLDKVTEPTKPDKG